MRRLRVSDQLGCPPFLQPRYNRRPNDHYFLKKKTSTMMPDARRMSNLKNFVTNVSITNLHQSVPGTGTEFSKHYFSRVRASESLTCGVDLICVHMLSVIFI
jgi:hypothetical protein